MKKTLSTLAFLSVLAPAAVFAAPNSMGQGSYLFNGPYGGLDLGFSSMNSHIEIGTTSADQGSVGFAYGGFLGYGMQIQDGWYFGGELGLGDTTGSVKLNTATAGAKETQDYNLNVDARAGKIVGQSTLAYAKLGWAHSEFDQFAASNGSSTSNSTAFDGIRVGAGAETYLMDHLTGRLEAVYTDYGSQTAGNAKFAPSDVGVRFGVAYYFQ